MAEWHRASPFFTLEESDAFRRLVCPLIIDLRGRYSIHEVIKWVGEEKVWLYYTRDDSEEDEVSSMAILRVKEYPSSLRILSVELAAGQLEDFCGTIDFLNDLAKKNDCSLVDFEGRPGWKRAALGDRFCEISRSYQMEVK